jgi:phosphohistidine phosphatase SixA
MSPPSLPARRAALLAVLLAVVAGGAEADEAAAWAGLREGRAIALMRHADAPGVADPAGFRLDDCGTQRNLSERGREEAKAVGRRLKSEGIAVARLVSSPWCRCMETATLMDMGTVTSEPTFGNVVVLAAQREALTAGARRYLAAWRGAGNLVVVTHGANIRALLDGPNPMSGEIVVVRRGADGALSELGRIPAPPVR